MYSDGTKDRRRTSKIPTLKARILLVRLFFACQGLKIGINRQPPFRRFNLKCYSALSAAYTSTSFFR